MNHQGIVRLEGLGKLKKIHSAHLSAAGGENTAANSSFKNSKLSYAE
jgi:hypothetical protein